MSTLGQVFGGIELPLEAVVDCRVTRARARGAMSIAVGAQPVWLKLRLHDGRSFEAHARAPGPKRDAIEAAIAELTSFRVAQSMRALSAGTSVPFGDIVLTYEGILRGGALTRWEEIAAWNVSHGYLLVQSASAGKWRLWLGKVPFSDALVGVIDRSVPGRRSPGMALGSPLVGKVLLGVVAAAVLVTALVYGVDWLQQRQRRAEWEKLPRGAALVDEAAPIFADRASLDALPTCPRAAITQRTALVAADKSSVTTYAPGFGWTPSELSEALSPTVPSFFVWAREGATVRVVSWGRAEGRARCTVVRQVPPGADAALLAREAMLGIPERAPARSGAAGGTPTQRPLTGPRTPQRTP